MREANSFDIFLLVLLGLIWGSSFFNIKIATYSYEPITLALVRVIFASAPLILLCKFKKIKIEAFSKEWKYYALIGLCNIAIPFILIAIGTSKINSYLAAMLATLGVVLGAAYMLWLTKRVIFGVTKNSNIETLSDVNKPEMIMLSTLAFFVIFFRFSDFCFKNFLVGSFFSSFLRCPLSCLSALRFFRNSRSRFFSKVNT